MRTPVITGAIGVALATVAASMSVPAASAAPFASVQVTLKTPAPVTITSGKCQDVPIEYAFSTSGTVQRIAVESEIWKGDQYLSSTFAYVYPSEGGTVLADSHYNCGQIGTFRVGPTTGEWNNADYDEFALSIPGNVYYTARQGSRFKNAKIIRKGTTRSYSAKGQYFDSALSRWSAIPKGTKVSLERQKGTGSWKHVKTVRAGKKGAVKVSTKTSDKYSYRLAVKGTSRTWASYSRVIRK